jgi:hypothetical protein
MSSNDKNCQNWDTETGEPGLLAGEYQQIALRGRSVLFALRGRSVAITRAARTAAAPGGDAADLPSREIWPRQQSSSAWHHSPPARKQGPRLDTQTSGMSRAPAGTPLQLPDWPRRYP